MPVSTSQVTAWLKQLPAGTSEHPSRLDRVQDTPPGGGSTRGSSRDRLELIGTAAQRRHCCVDRGLSVRT